MWSVGQLFEHLLLTVIMATITAYDDNMIFGSDNMTLDKLAIWIPESEIERYVGKCVGDLDPGIRDRTLCG